MIEHVVTESNWFLPQLLQMLHSPAAALFPVVPVASFTTATVLDEDGDDPLWASLWTKTEVQADASAGADVVATIALTPREHRAAQTLLSYRYKQRGYGVGSASCDQVPKQRELTLLAWSRDDSVIGTLSMGFDGGAGLLADGAYGSVLDSIRARGRSICEFTRFAVSAVADSKETIGRMFDLSYVLGRNLLGVTDVVIEVNPRHVAFYRRAFGFRPVSDVRTCERVNAPAVLLRLDVAELEGRMGEAGARMPGELALARH
jgi:hypothetical protein